MARLLVTLALVGASTQAQEDELAPFRICASEKEDAARLQCFDAAVSGLPAVPAEARSPLDEQPDLGDLALPANHEELVALFESAAADHDIARLRRMTTLVLDNVGEYRAALPRIKGFVDWAVSDEAARAWDDIRSDITEFCITAVKERLKAPATAVFPADIGTGIYGLGGGHFGLWSHYDAENSYGALLRGAFACKVRRDSDTGAIFLASIQMN